MKITLSEPEQKLAETAVHNIVSHILGTRNWEADTDFIYDEIYRLLAQTPTKTVDTPSEPSIDGRTESKGVDTNTPRSVEQEVKALDIVHTEWGDTVHVKDVIELLTTRDASIRAEERERIEGEFGDYLTALDAEKGQCECSDKKHEQSMAVYDVAKKHIIIRLRTGIKMAASCDGVNPNLSEALTPTENITTKDATPKP